MRRFRRRSLGCSVCRARMRDCEITIAMKPGPTEANRKKRCAVNTIDISTVDKRVATVTLKRPEVRNAFNEQTIAEITRAFRELGANEDIRAIVLAAKGAAFCAGADLNWMKKMAGYSYEEN